MKKITIYTDGACSGNPGPGGWGTIIVYNEIEKELCGGEKNTTNNRMELTAVIEGLAALKEPCQVHIVSDSKYVTEAINSWLKNWIKKGFDKVKNPELWIRYVEVSKQHKITTEWVKGHSGHEMNERCDKLAVSQVRK
jgi:ribonuclease HI